MGDLEQLPKESPMTSGHLFLLIHGLWGGPNHMTTIERCLKQLLPERSQEKIITIKPSCFRFWKTYDGLKINSERIIADMFYELEALKQKSNCKVIKFSIVGYSLGGLIARYIIGILHELGFFDQVQPVFFTTFATPHVGIEYFNNNFFDKTANQFGQYLFGISGKQLFIADKDKILVQMADPNQRYMAGLKLFQKHILLANVKNDRTVAFFTSYITENSPFDKWDDIKIEYLSDVPSSKIGKIQVKPKFVDLYNSTNAKEGRDKHFKGNVQEQTSILRSNKILRFLIIFVVASFLLPIWVPFVLSSSLMASIYSAIKVRIIKPPSVSSHWTRVSNSVYGNKPVDAEDAAIGLKNRVKRRNFARHESFKGDTSELTETTMEGIMYAEERFIGKSPEIQTADGEGYFDSRMVDETTIKHADVNDKDDDDEDDDNNFDNSEDSSDDFTGSTTKKIIEVDTALNDHTIKKNFSILTTKDCSNFSLFTPQTKLSLGKDKLFIIRALNSIDWIKIPVYIDAWNAHDGIVARRGPKTNPKGTSTISLWVSILRNHLSDDLISSH